MFDFLYFAVSWVLLRWHQLFTIIGLPADGGANWALSIALLVVTARLLLFRFVLGQVRYLRRMQQVQPKIDALRSKHRNDKAALQRELLALQQAEGLNPLAGCLPVLAQWPVILGLLHVLRHLAAAASPAYQLAHPGRLTLYGFTRTQTLSAAQAKVFGAPLAAHLLSGASGVTAALIVAVALVSAAATYLTQRLIRAAQVVAPQGTAATVQRWTAVLIPLGTLGSALFFPLGVLWYWLVSNAWTAGQQAYLAWRHPPESARAR